METNKDDPRRILLRFIIEGGLDEIGMHINNPLYSKVVDEMDKTITVMMDTMREELELLRDLNKEKEKIVDLVVSLELKSQTIRDLYRELEVKKQKVTELTQRVASVQLCLEEYKRNAITEEVWNQTEFQTGLIRMGAECMLNMLRDHIDGSGFIYQAECDGRKHMDRGDHPIL